MHVVHWIHQLVSSHSMYVNLVYTGREPAKLFSFEKENWNRCEDIEFQWHLSSCSSLSLRPGSVFHFEFCELFLNPHIRRPSHKLSKDSFRRFLYLQLNNKNGNNKSKRKKNTPIISTNIIFNQISPGGRPVVSRSTFLMASSPEPKNPHQDSGSPLGPSSHTSSV